jgi:glycerophosphoryl diester phosphodiesterase
MPGLIRVGHKGADLIAPGNTLESFDAARAAGVDMIEFDVLPARADDRLLLAHDYEDAGGRTPPTLEQGLAHLSGEAFEGIELDIDLKLRGYELRVLDAVRTRGLIDRVLISSQYRRSLALINAAEPGVRLGWSVPKFKRDPFRSVLMRPFAVAGLVVVRAVFPWRARRAIRSHACDAVMAHWRLATPRLVRAVLGAGGELYVWTVDELPQMRRLEALGVTGVITNDPRLFAALA